MSGLIDRIRQFESMHIIFWLIKDSCWMLELKATGTLMIIPTFSLAVYLMYRTYKTLDFYLNTAIFFWISANSFWMLMEFFNKNLLKGYALIPFIFGIITVMLFYFKQLDKKSREEDLN
jgi:hypothetical protein